MRRPPPRAILLAEGVTRTAARPRTGGAVNAPVSPPYATPDERWAAIVARDRAADGAFV